jgi:hypothetical protein
LFSEVNINRSISFTPLPFKYGITFLSAEVYLADDVPAFTRILFSDGEVIRHELEFPTSRYAKVTFGFSFSRERSAKKFKVSIIAMAILGTKFSLLDVKKQISQDNRDIISSQSAQ